MTRFEVGGRQLCVHVLETEGNWLKVVDAAVVKKQEALDGMQKNSSTSVGYL